MIKKLRHKFILISMLSVFAVMVLVIGSINAINLYQKTAEQNQMLDFLTQYDGSFPTFHKYGAGNGTGNGKNQNNQQNQSNDQQTDNSDNNDRTDSTDGSGDTLVLPPDKPDTDSNVYFPKMNAETQFRTRFFTVCADSTGSIEKIRTENIAAVDETLAKEYAETILKSGDTDGWVDIYKYKVVDNSNSGKLIVFLDCNEDVQSSMSLLIISLIIGVCSLVIVFLLVSIFSRKAMKPFAESFEKQKQFITDASHEIKTPLAIISANADVLSITEGENEWIQSIQNQTKRLTGLVKNLVSLAKMDEERTQLVFAEFNVSDAVLDAAAPFEVVAQKSGKKFEYDVEQDITFNGDEASIRQLTALLTDNAIKYSVADGNINIKLYKKAKALHFEISNKAENVDKESLSRLFDRFYRSDESRAREQGETGGYGIGLSIAKAIVTAHKGKINALCDGDLGSDHDGLITFSVVLPM